MNKLQWNFNRNSHIFIQENTLQNVVCEMASILSRPQCVEWMPQDLSNYKTNLVQIISWCQQAPNHSWSTSKKHFLDTNSLICVSLRQWYMVLTATVVHKSFWSYSFMFEDLIMWIHLSRSDCFHEDMLLNWIDFELFSVVWEQY